MDDTDQLIRLNSTAGVGSFDDGKGHYMFTFTLEGHYAYRVKTS